MSAGPYEIEVVIVNDPTAPTQRARVVRTRHGALVYLTLLNGAPGGLPLAARGFESPAEFDSWERAIACVNRWMHGEEWRW